MAPPPRINFSKSSPKIFVRSFLFHSEPFLWMSSSFPMYARRGVLEEPNRLPRRSQRQIASRYPNGHRHSVVPRCLLRRKPGQPGSLAGDCPKNARGIDNLSEHLMFRYT